VCGRFRRGGLTGSRFRLGLLLLLLVDRCEILDRDEDVLFGDNIGSPAPDETEASTPGGFNPVDSSLSKARSLREEMPVKLGALAAFNCEY
jgi:hypothetical protein